MLNSVGPLDNFDASTLKLFAFHSLCPNINSECDTEVGQGLIGWIAQTGTPLHVSPFERDSKILPAYREDLQLKSFIGVPIKLSSSMTGVLACDSKKSFAFSRIQVKLLEQHAEQIAATISMAVNMSQQLQSKDPWSNFVTQVEQYKARNPQCHTDLLRIRAANYELLESSLGLSEAANLIDRCFDILKRATAGNPPSIVASNGDLILVIDQMMATYVENRVIALCGRVVSDGLSINPIVGRALRYDRRARTRNRTLDQLVNAALEDILEQILHSNGQRSLTQNSNDQSKEHRYAG